MYIYITYNVRMFMFSTFLMFPHENHKDFLVQTEETDWGLFWAFTVFFF